VAVTVCGTTGEVVAVEVETVAVTVAAVELRGVPELILVR